MASVMTDRRFTFTQDIRERLRVVGHDVSTREVEQALRRLVLAGFVKKRKYLRRRMYKFTAP